MSYPITQKKTHLPDGVQPGPFPTLRPFFVRNLLDVTLEWSERQQRAAGLQAEAERRLAGCGLPPVIAAWIRAGETNRPYPNGDWDETGSLWNDLNDAGEEERAAARALEEFLAANDTGSPCQPWELTQAEYIGDPKVYGLAPWSEERGLDGAGEYIEHTLRIFRPGYAVARILGEGRGVVLLKAIGAEWLPVGSYRGLELGIISSERGQGLSAELIWEKGRANGGSPVGGGYSEAGLRAHLSAHRKAVASAFALGLIDPASDLARCHFENYPELVGQFSLPVQG